MINQAWKPQLSSMCFFQHHLHSCSFPEENVCRTRSRGDTCRRTAGAINHAISNGPYSVLATVLCIILKCGQEVSATVMKASSQHVSNNVLCAIHCDYNKYITGNITLLTCISGFQVWILTWTLRILRGSWFFSVHSQIFPHIIPRKSPYVPVSGHYSLMNLQFKAIL